jgi:hypothetical protein
MEKKKLMLKRERKGRLSLEEYEEGIKKKKLAD